LPVQTRKTNRGLAILAIVGRLSEEDGSLGELNQAFEPRYRLSPDKAHELAFFKNHYLRAEESWRRVDTAWLGVAEGMAIALNQGIKTSALSFAIELERGGRVLLFPGDSQSSILDSLVTRGSAETPYRTAPDVRDLLRRTVLYKASLHKDGNGALESGALDYLTDLHLVAMIPAGYDSERLPEWLHRTRGRFLSSQLGVAERSDGLSGIEWQEFLRRVRVDAAGMYLEYET
jgi:hypothetical protein